MAKFDIIPRRLIWFSFSSSAAVKNRKYLSENYLESIEQPVSETSLIGHLSISNKMKTESLLAKTLSVFKVCSSADG